MDIIYLDFQKPLTLSIHGKIVEIIAFKTDEYGLIKFGINAPFDLKINREEIYHAKQRKRVLESV